MADLEWRYTFHNALTGAYVDDLPLDGVEFDYGMPPTQGNFTGDLYLGDRSINSKSWQAATAERQNVIHVWVNGILLPPVFFLWDTDYSRSQRKLTLTATELWSYYHRRTVDRDYTFAQVEQLDIFRTLFADAAYTDITPDGQTLPRWCGNLLVTPDSTVTGVLRDRTYTANDGKDLASMCEELSAVINGFDFVLESYLVTAGEPGRRIRFGYPRLGYDQSTSNIQFRAVERGQGNIEDFDWPITGSAAYNVREALGDNTTRNDAVDLSQLNAGVPLLEKSIVYSGVSDADTLKAHAQADLAASSDPQGLPSITVRLDQDPVIGSYSLGDDALIHIEDYARFPGPWDSADGLDHRINGWFRLVDIKMTPASAQGQLTFNSANVTAYRESAANQAASA